MAARANTSFRLQWDLHRHSGDSAQGAPVSDGRQPDTPRKHVTYAIQKYQWQLEAWAVFSNHYHFVGRSRPESGNLRQFLKHVHADSARELNRLDGKIGRTVWFNFWETKLTYERSYLARLSYVRRNPVKHGLVLVANQYRWCSAAWFERVASPAIVKTLYDFKIDKLTIKDDF